jgi:hypothetical protein
MRRKKRGGGGVLPLTSGTQKRRRVSIGNVFFIIIVESFACVL